MDISKHKQSKIDAREDSVETVANYQEKNRFRLPDQNPIVATRHIDPATCSSAEQYVNSKMGALLGSGIRWAQGGDAQKDHARRYQEIRSRVEGGDDEAVFELIRNDISALGDELVLARIWAWQDQMLSGNPAMKVKAGNRLKRIGTSLVPERRDAGKKRVAEREDVLKLFWTLEWQWFHLLKSLYAADLLFSDTARVKAEAERLGLNVEECLALIKKVQTKELEPDAHRIAVYLIGLKHQGDEETALDMLC